MVAIKEGFARLKTLNLPWILVALVVLQKMVSTLFNSTMGSSVFSLLEYFCKYFHDTHI